MEFLRSATRSKQLDVFKKIWGKYFGKAQESLVINIIIDNTTFLLQNEDAQKCTKSFVLFYKLSSHTIISTNAAACHLFKRIEHSFLFLVAWNILFSFLNIEHSLGILHIFAIIWEHINKVQKWS